MSLPRVIVQVRFWYRIVSANDLDRSAVAGGSGKGACVSASGFLETHLGGSDRLSQPHGSARGSRYIRGRQTEVGSSNIPGVCNDDVVEWRIGSPEARQANFNCHCVRSDGMQRMPTQW